MNYDMAWQRLQSNCFLHRENLSQVWALFKFGEFRYNQEIIIHWMKKIVSMSILP